MVLLALFGATMGQGVVWYTGQFYAMSFLKTTCAVESVQTEVMISIGLICATPFFVIFGALSDKIGRRNIMLLGMLLAVLTYRPIYTYKFELSNPASKEEIASESKTEIKKEAIASKNDSSMGTDSLISTITVKTFRDGSVYKEVKKETILADKSKEALKPEIKKEMTLGESPKWTMIFLIFIQVIYVTMVYGPIAAFLVEIFPTRIRYTSMSLPYHIGNGVFGGLLPYLATRFVEATKETPTSAPSDPLAGLWYPIIIAGVCFVIGALYLNNKTEINNE